MRSYKRRFYMREPVTKEPIYLVEGELGYRPVPTIWPNVNSRNCLCDIDTKLNTLNAFYNNTPKDLTIALSCSMFGWDIPFANELSKEV